MSDIGDRPERLRRWGWVLVGVGLPGVGLLAYVAFNMVVIGLSPGLDVLLVVGVLATPFPLGVRMIARGIASEGRIIADEPRDVIGARPGFVLLLVFVLGGLGYLAVPVCGCTTREKAYVAAVRSDLLNLRSQQEIYHADAGTYSAIGSELGFVTSEGVHVDVVATPTGWTARAWHDALGHGSGCALYHGDVARVLATGGGMRPSEPDVLACDD